ncbi:MAG: ATP-binding protein [Candidatus Dependentiae bacterium]|nr:ATP-binding protein [Candidatus Dependentiae bacterium]
MFISRNIAQVMPKFQKFPVIAILGPRQSGKTTFAQNWFKNHTFVSFEQAHILQEAQLDPEKFLKRYENDYGIIIDEFQYAPEILSHIKYISDKINRPGYFVLTGSSNFLMNQQITESLAGRIGILTLLPFSIQELKQGNLIVGLDEMILRGGYPRVYTQDFDPDVFYPSYIHSYVERDVRQLSAIGDLQEFKKFMHLCAGRIGQLLNTSDLAVSCGIAQKTVERWLSILQASYVIFLLQPYHANFNKRLIKQPKIYFYDTGLVCSLLYIKNANSLSQSHMYGHIFENFIVADLYKQYSNAGTQPPLYFWRDKNGRIEVDCLIDQGSQLVPIEIKSSMTPRSEYFNGLLKFNEISSGQRSDQNYVIYAGDIDQKMHSGMMIGWKEFGNFISTINN